MFLHLCVILFTVGRGGLASLHESQVTWLGRGVSIWRWGGLYQGVCIQRGRWVCIQEGGSLLPGELGVRIQRASASDRGSASRERGICPPPPDLGKASGMHPTGMLSRFLLKLHFEVFENLFIKLLNEINNNKKTDFKSWKRYLCR